MLAIATKKGAKIKVPGHWAEMEKTVQCQHPGCKAEYFLGQQQPFKDDKLWPMQIEELLVILKDDHKNRRKHSDKMEFDL